MADDIAFEDVPGSSPGQSDPPDAVALRIANAPKPIEFAFSAEIINSMADRCLNDAPAFESTLVEVRNANIQGLRVGEWERRIRTRAKELKLAGKKRPASNAKDWKSQLVYENGKPKANEANCITALARAPEWKGVLAFNEFANNVVKLKPPPWWRDDIAVGAVTTGEWVEGDDVRTVVWFQRTLDMDVKLPVVMNALSVISTRNSFHPVREYLDGLAWDRKPRLQRWLATYAGANSQPPEYLERVGMWFMISAVARIYSPGCKVDHSIILEGKQGRGKSTLVKTLTPNEEWFAEHNANLLDKDAYAILQGRWILELAELDSLRGADVGRTKRYMSTPTDCYRPVWARRVARFPRHCVFIGTVNESQYLRDATGNRRSWPVAIGVIDIDALIRDRDQLWAEAVHHYRNGAIWWPQRDDEALLENEQEDRFRADVWEEPIASWLDQWLSKPVWTPSPGTTRPATHRLECISTNEILSGAIRKDVADQTPGDDSRVGSIMGRLDWTRRQSRSANENPEDRDSNGKRRRVWAYFPPVKP
jgi:predicted P-loop ATPase